MSSFSKLSECRSGARGLCMSFLSNPRTEISDLRIFPSFEARRGVDVVRIRTIVRVTNVPICQD